MSQYPHEKIYWSDEAQQTIKKEIASLLYDNNLLLVTGAGFSTNFGYPMWGQFLDELNEDIGSPINKNDDICKTEGILDYLKYAQEIENKIESDPSLENELANIIQTRFSREKFVVNADFYKNLLELGFNGFVTLNYDISLELLIRKYQLSNNSINSINVCNKDSKIEIKNFLDNASEKKDTFDNVLHLHGLYKEHSTIILTQSSYDDWYHKGSLQEIENLKQDLTLKINGYNEPVIIGKFSEFLSRINLMFDPRTLNSDHKKLIWLIFARYRILFVGFSADDSYFMNLLDIVKDDFLMPRKPIHYVFVKYTPDEPTKVKEEKERCCERLIKKGLWPIFYPVIDNNYEAGLEKIVLEIESLKKGNETKQSTSADKRPREQPVGGKTITDITNKTMRLK